MTTPAILVRGGTVVNADRTCRADVLVRGTSIEAVRDHIEVDEGVLVIDATDRLVIPGGVDVHTHLDSPLQGAHTSDDIPSGARAAAFGGTTTVITFALPNRGESLPDALERWAELVRDAVIDVGFHLVVREFRPCLESEIAEVAREGVTSVKVYMAYPGELMIDDAAMFRVLETAGRNGVLTCVHAENAGVIDVLVRRALDAGRTSPRHHAETRPTTAEGEATNRAAALASMAGAPLYVVHLSCLEAVHAVESWRSSGAPVFAETCPHYLVLDDSAYQRDGFESAKFVVSPPLRPEPHQDHLWRGLRDDVLQVVSTDHCPTCTGTKRRLGHADFTKIPNGGVGIEHRLALLHTFGVGAGKLTLERMVDVFATSPARLFGLFPRKGLIAPGSDADLVVFDPTADRVLSSSTHHMRVDYSMYEGLPVKGAAEVVIASGKVVIRDGVLVAGRPNGGYLRRAASGVS